MAKNVKSTTFEKDLMAEGECFSLYGIKRNGKSNIRNFLSKLNLGDRKKVFALVNRIADHGKIMNIEKFKHEEDGIYAIKSGQVRIYCCFHGKKVVLLTNGAIKKQNKANPADLEKAKKIRKETEALF
ncbi:protein of unknown function DUF891 [Desulfatibacillum aliphaticivorans]|uniref:Type II toxin-antitoxin system RelE/ParE family toxin n=1 Tax=Desulfatibacillum aliphaticivorans TaxID=218208 RepID=B8FAJ8_DESAL|nr:type II toxin-antitoxin system RelE/ParE family toxin [Desulfatibacillum aliphaticivorans]ACL03294.1 protein of unknown function DUF891 [Desulfatibacillum aliphaticivorans]